MIRNFATLFDRNYLEKGLCLHDSLLRHSSEEFKLHVLCMDMPTFWLLDEMELRNVDLLPIDVFEAAMHLERVRANRTHQEWCWTAASQLCEYLLLSMDDGITYLDSDIFFFSDPGVVFAEIGERSIGITPHRFNEKEQQRLGANGKFNVGWVSLKNTDVGRQCIAKWAEQCRQRCSAKVGCGDQQYLDSWPTDYPGKVCEIQNIGANAAPWNIGNYRIMPDGDRVYLNDTKLVFYHAHEFAEREDGTFRLTGWAITDESVRWIYRPYVAAIMAAKAKIAIAVESIEARHHEMQLQSERA